MDRTELIEYGVKELAWTVKRRDQIREEVEAGGEVGIQQFFPVFGKKAFSNTIKGLTIPQQLLFTGGLFVHVPPFKDEFEFQDGMGIAYHDFLDLVEGKYVKPFVNSFLNRYDGLDYMAPLLEKRLPTYIRYAGFFNMLADEPDGYYQHYFQAVSRFSGKLGDHPEMKDWAAHRHRAGSAFEKKVAFNYARLRIMYPERARFIDKIPDVQGQVQAILASDDVAVAPVTKAFDHLYRFSPSWAADGSDTPPANPFPAHLVRQVSRAFDLEYPASIDYTELKSLLRQKVWRQGQRLIASLEKAVADEEERVQDHALALQETWAEVAEGLRATERRIDTAARIAATVSLGTIGLVGALSSGQWESVDYALSHRLGAEDLGRRALGGAAYLGRSNHIADAWRFKRSTEHALREAARQKHGEHAT